MKADQIQHPEPANDGDNAAVIEATQPAARSRYGLPSDAMIIVPARNLVLFPGFVMPINIGRQKSIAAAQEAARSGAQIGVLLQRDAAADDPKLDQLHQIGTVASIARYITAQNNEHYIVCQGHQRFHVLEFLKGYPFYVARVQVLPQAPSELVATMQNTTSPAAYTDFVAGLMDFSAEEKQDVLETLDLPKRMDKVLNFLAHRLEVLRLSKRIDQETKERMDDRQREFMLREHLKTIQKELGKTEDENAEVADLAEAIANTNMPEEVEKHAKKELRRLEKMPEAAGEYSMLRTYLEWLTELPWSALPEDRIDLPDAARILDEDHFGLEKVKRRIIEYLAVRILNPEGRSPILCFVGPPGVG